MYEVAESCFIVLTCKLIFGQVMKNTSRDSERIESRILSLVMGTVTGKGKLGTESSTELFPLYNFNFEVISIVSEQK